MSKRFGRKDALFLAGIFLAACLLLAFFYLGNRKEGSNVIVTIDGEVFGIYPLSEDAVISIGTGKVTNVLEIHDGQAKMAEADCPDQLCVHQKAVSYDRESIICLPNKVVVTVESNIENELDAVAE